MALLAALGVDLIVLVAFVAFILARNRPVRHQTGAFAGQLGDQAVIRLRTGAPRWRLPLPAMRTR